ncbi:hypothetical protein CDO73_16425 [Saccharibacillus sp. O23]|uniref:abortive infection system antitoxin AbiGi family protein n=1 Tax=Saccharibacillus sp. O23 TaxID=2009338 RepID=UPI000B4E1AFE|nr:abortive infection system antitoxin AbiGi family protein [Saccharibacillus sp. O23]OWR28989.1 hypothetical protein CDO73_16425 [Saccharibacillus sp. O23]
MSRKIEEILSHRTDISRYVVHLTKAYRTNSAKENLVSIIQDKMIHAYDHHCLFSPKLRKEDEEIQKKFRVVCFTETPLDKIHLLTNISGRKVELEPYGLVFKKSKVISARGNPVSYVYKENNLLLKYLTRQYDEYTRTYYDDEPEELVADFNTFGSIVNIVRAGHDFHWEREWRVRKMLEFDCAEIFAVIAPSNDHKEIRELIGSDDIKYTPFIDAGWNYEEMLNELACYLWNEIRQEQL